MTGPQGGEKYRIMAEINMIPLIDIALVLLIIFMIMTPILVKSQIKIQLPGASTGAQQNTAGIVEIQVTRNGLLYLYGHAVPDEELAARLKRALPNPAQQPLAIEADKDAPFQRVIKVMDTARQLGVLKISVGVKPLPGPPGAGSVAGRSR